MDWVTTGTGTARTPSPTRRTRKVDFPMEVAAVTPFILQPIHHMAAAVVSSGTAAVAGSSPPRPRCTVEAEGTLKVGVIMRPKGAVPGPGC